MSNPKKDMLGGCRLSSLKLSFWIGACNTAWVVEVKLPKLPQSALMGARTVSAQQNTTALKTVTVRYSGCGGVSRRLGILHQMTELKRQVRVRVARAISAMFSSP